MKRLLLPCLFFAACVLLGLSLRDVDALGDPHVPQVVVLHSEPELDAMPADALEPAIDAGAVTLTVPAGTSATVQSPAAAVPPSTVSVPPTKDDVGFLGYLMSGKYLLAVGAALVGAVAVIRVPLAKYVPWFASKIGGYTLGFGSAAILYFGTALTQGVAPNPALLSAALVAGFAASGKWEALQDVLASLRRPPETKSSSTATASPTTPAPRPNILRSDSARPTAVAPALCASCGQPDPTKGGAA